MQELKSVRAIAEKLQITYSAAFRTDDSKPDIRYWISVADSTRELIVRRDVGKDRAIGSPLEQRLSCLEVIKVPAYECCGLPSEFDIRRTKEKLPAFVQGTNGPLYTYIGGIGGFSDFQMIASQRVRNACYAPITGHLRKAVLMNDYVYLINDPETEEIEVAGVFSNPLEAGILETGNEACIDLDSRYPIYGWMEEVIIQEAFKTMQMLRQGRPELVNDSSGVK